MSRDKQDELALAGNDIEVTDAEAAALKTDDEATAAEAATAAAAANAAGGEATPPKTEDKPLEEGNAAATAAAAEQAPPAVAAEPPPPAAPFVPVLPADQRDYAAEVNTIDQQLKQLKTEYRSGDSDLSDEDYESRYEQLQEQKLGIKNDWNTAKLRAEFNTASADQAWAYQQQQFLALAQNAAIAKNAEVFAAWESAMQGVVNAAARESRQITDWDIFVGARNRLAELGILPGADAAAPAAKPAPQAAGERSPKPDRTPPLGNVPQTLSAAPAAADPGAKTTTETLASREIEDVEDWLAGKSEAERDSLLKGLPGAFVDD